MLEQTKAFCFDTETTGLDSLVADVVGLAFSWQEHTGYYVYINEGDEQRVIDMFKPLFSNEKITKVAQNIKYDMRKTDLLCASEFHPSGTRKTRT